MKNEIKNKEGEEGEKNSSLSKGMLRLSFDSINENEKSLPELSDSLEELNINSVYINKLPKIPKSLKRLTLNCSIKFIPELPDSLEELNINSAPFKWFSEIPKFLKKLRLMNCSVTSIPELPDSLEELKLVNLSSIINLSNISESSLKKLVLTDCDISELEYLPEKLEELVCSKIILPELPSTLKKLIYTNSEVKELPTLPKSLIELVCNDCKNLTQLPNLPRTLVELHINNCKLERIQNMIGLMNLKKISIIRCSNLKIFQDTPYGLTDLDFSFCENLKEAPILNPFLKVLICDGCIKLKHIPFLAFNLETFSCDGCEKLEFSRSDLPSTLKFFSHKGCLRFKENFNSLLNCFYDPISNLVFGNEYKEGKEDSKIVVGIIRNEMIQPIDKECIRLCKKYGFKYKTSTQKAELVTCVICLENQPSIMLNECHHLVYCSECFLNIKNLKCPKCRMDNEDTIKVYL